MNLDPLNVISTALQPFHFTEVSGVISSSSLSPSSSLSKATAASRTRTRSMCESVSTTYP